MCVVSVHVSIYREGTAGRVRLGVESVRWIGDQVK